MYLFIFWLSTHLVSRRHRPSLDASFRKVIQLVKSPLYRFKVSTTFPKTFWRISSFSKTCPSLGNTSSNVTTLPRILTTVETLTETPSAGCLLPLAVHCAHPPKLPINCSKNRPHNLLRNLQHRCSATTGKYPPSLSIHTRGEIRGREINVFPLTAP